MMETLLGMQFIGLTAGITVARLCLAGLVNTKIKHMPCFFQLFSYGLDEDKKRKLHENVWYTMWHTLSFTLGIFYVTKQGWASELIWGNRTAALVEGYPQTAASIGCDRYYIIELSFWISCFLFLFFETRRKDIVEMTIHHVTTILLISISYMTGYARPGILVMIVHDIGDIFLYSAKTCQYRRLQGIADVLFAMFAVTFYITRLWCLPRYVIYPLVKHMWLDPRTGPIIGPMVEAGHLYTLMFLTSLLCVLVGLHTMWGTTIAKMIWKSMLCRDSVANNGDPRSDSEAEMENKRRRGPAAAVSRTKVHPPSMKERKHRG